MSKAINKDSQDEKDHSKVEKGDVYLMKITNSSIYHQMLTMALIAIMLFALAACASNLQLTAE
ncbi:hypothetical protein FACS1894172_02630 [Spirochaetia bacterium]|nr:hypothetical protein FACS1894164_19490 [Spirochaetia bacterium]GHU30106.1 hypothetical protein FACS1894172_02630 [Spirochaetia bacterium]